MLGAFALVVLAFIAVSFAARRLARAQDAETYYTAGLLRLEGRQPEGVADGKAFEPDDHLYAPDLDVFGPQSLFSMLNMARTSAGQETLAAWLLSPAPTPDEIVARQAAVAELAAAVELRESLWRAGGMVGRDVKPRALIAWLSATPEPASTRARVAAFAVGLIGLTGLVAVFAGEVGLAVAAFVVVWLLSRRFRPYVRSVGEGAQNRAEELTAVVKLAEIVEGTAFSSSKLNALKAALGAADRPARHAVNKLLRLVGYFEMRRSALLALLGTPVLAFTQFAMAIEIWRKNHGAAAAHWIAAIGELEALTSLGTFAFEHPALPFPEIVADSEGPRFEGEAVAHPLLPAETRVANDVSLHPQRRLLLVTGSNMSGKSTYLRTIGTNTVLALAGAPVVAKRLRLSRLAIGASLRTSDSLQAGVSRFFAEIQRLRSIVDLCENNRLALYLLDEILHGTNSEDRLAGGGALVKRLCERGSVGLCTTHDLALARIVDDLGTVAVNVHFEDVISDGKITFDYRLRPGVVTRGNAIALMKLVGLPV
ncbi:MAG TPA: DNA mismatch repair protein MutS [Polyangia bacterium]